jgi:hypothetical protein
MLITETTIDCLNLYKIRQAQIDAARLTRLKIYALKDVVKSTDDSAKSMDHWLKLFLPLFDGWYLLTSKQTDKSFIGVFVRKVPTGGASDPQTTQVDLVVTFEFYYNVGKSTIEVHFNENSDIASVPVIVEQLQKMLATVKNADDVRVDFHHASKNGNNTISRDLAVPKWDDIKANYPVDVRAKIQSLVDTDFSKVASGKLVFWSGPPGTGKTFAIRSLMYAWRNTVIPHVVIDPEAFFNDAAYMYSVILTDNYDDFDYDDETGEPYKGKNVHLLVVEDSPDLLFQVTRGHNSAAMARLLNLTDGLLGQGIKLLVLMTTNETMEEIDSAYLRPGRCLQKLEFSKFDSSEAGDWLKAHGSDASVKEAALAELYEIIRTGEVPGQEKSSFGFGS